MAKRSALGKGLGAYLPEAKDLLTKNGIIEIKLEEISANPFQPRESFDEDALNELADSIRSLGIIQPLTLRQTAPKQYQIISGERRYRAAKLAGLASVPAYVRTADDTAMLEMAIVENIQREDLDPIETAVSFQRLIDECGLTQENMADKVGKKRATITNYLRLLKLPAQIQSELKKGTISTGHAKALLSAEDDDAKIKLCQLTVSNGWSVRQLEERVRFLGLPAPEPKKREEMSASCINAARVLGKYFNGKVAVRQTAGGKGTITIKFKNESQLEALLKALEEN
jgi:ParB-like partition proteins